MKKLALTAIAVLPFVLSAQALAEESKKYSLGAGTHSLTYKLSAFGNSASFSYSGFSVYFNGGIAESFRFQSALYNSKDKEYGVSVLGTEFAIQYINNPYTEGFKYFGGLGFLSEFYYDDFNTSDTYYGIIGSGGVGYNIGMLNLEGVYNHRIMHQYHNEVQDAFYDVFGFDMSMSSYSLAVRGGFRF